MTEQQVFELLGRKQAQLEEVIANYANLITIVRGIKAGEVSVDRLKIEANGVWTLEAAGETKAV